MREDARACRLAVSGVMDGRKAAAGAVGGAEGAAGEWLPGDGNAVDEAKIVDGCCLPAVKGEVVLSGAARSVCRAAAGGATGARMVVAGAGDEAAGAPGEELCEDGLVLLHESQSD